ncbi:MAG: hypothetical protein JW750_10560, partial [Anaerolineaceae bacterium]|nr:hypothetical protein [Anaerolineaceae bacterium]
GMIWLGVKNDWFGGTAADPTEAQTEISLNRKITPTPQDQEQAPTSAPTSAPSPTPERAQPFTEIEGLDEDIPVLLDNNGDLVTSEAQEMTMWMFTTDLTLEEVVEFYEGGMAATKWQLLTRSEVQASDTVIYYYQEGQRFLQISLVEEEDGLMVSLMRQENP